MFDAKMHAAVESMRQQCGVDLSDAEAMKALIQEVDAIFYQEATVRGGGQFREALKETGLKQIDFGRAFGIGKRALTSWCDRFEGRPPPWAEQVLTLLLRQHRGGQDVRAVVNALSRCN